MTGQLSELIEKLIEAKHWDQARLGAKLKPPHRQPDVSKIANGSKWQTHYAIIVQLLGMAREVGIDPVGEYIAAQGLKAPSDKEGADALRSLQALATAQNNESRKKMPSKAHSVDALPTREPPRRSRR